MNHYLGLNTEQNFSGIFMILAEWRDVHPYPHGSCYLCDFLRRFPSMRSFMNQVWFVVGLMTISVKDMHCACSYIEWIHKFLIMAFRSVLLISKANL